MRLHSRSPAILRIIIASIMEVGPLNANTVANHFLNWEIWKSTSQRCTRVNHFIMNIIIFKPKMLKPTAKDPQSLSSWASVVTLTALDSSKLLQLQIKIKFNRLNLWLGSMVFLKINFRWIIPKHDKMEQIKYRAFPHRI